MKIKAVSLKAVVMSLILLMPDMAFAEESDKMVFLDRNASPSERAADLVKRLTLDEKASLMLFESNAIPRLGIKGYNWWNEALHGVARSGYATMYPMPIGMAASFDPALLEEVFTSVSDEARIKSRIASAKGCLDQYEGLTFWTPNINIFRDPRWGRGMETYGEDPYLTAIMGLAVVKGLQQDEGAANEKVHACAKHYAVHSGPESERHRFDAQVSDRDLYETYLYAFETLVKKGNVREVMFAYNRFRGVPCGANTELLQDILRNKWGYKGLIVSDCWAVSDFYEDGCHGYVETPAQGAAASVKAGLNLECGQSLSALPDAVRQGLIDESLVDERLQLVLESRFRLGEMDGESCWDSIPEEKLLSREHKEQSLKMALETMVLLKNDGVLPLSPSQKVALVGPNAADSVMMWGNYEGTPVKTVTLLEAMNEKFADVKYLKGCDYVLDTISSERLDSILRELDGFQTVVFAGGISPRLEGEELPLKIPGFMGGDRTSIELPQVQRDLISALAAAGKKVVLVNFSGSTMALAPEDVCCSAILQAWYPGQEGGAAVAMTLVGESNPSGKLPLTFYKTTDQIPDFRNYDMAGHTYRYFKGEPLYPFGYGLSYSSFKYVKVRKAWFGRKIIVKVKNTGDRDGVETVQLYVNRNSDAEGPIKSLRAFRRVSIPAGKTVKVVFEMDDEMFRWWNPETNSMDVTPGRFTIFCGGSSADADKHQVTYKTRK